MVDIDLGFVQYCDLLEAMSARVLEYEGVVEACQCLQRGFQTVGIGELVSQVGGLLSFVKYVDPRCVNGLCEYMVSGRVEFVRRWEDLAPERQFAGELHLGRSVCRMLASCPHAVEASDLHDQSTCGVCV